MEAQNIVQNGGFEEIDFCPNSAGQIWLARSWSSSFGSPDLYSSCGTLGYGMPTNYIGSQQARTGSGYASFATYSEAFSDNHEILQGELKRGLVGGQTYYFQAYVSQCDSLQYATNNIGITFTKVDTFTFLPCYLNCNVYYENDASNPLTSKTDWMRVNGTFTAIGGERYLHIGNLRPDSVSDIEFIGGGTTSGVGWNASGYYIDDVWLSHIDSAGYVSVNEQLSMDNYEFEVYPNPSTGGSVTVKYNLLGGDAAELRVFDMSGRQVYRNNEVCGANIIELTDLSEGLYHCLLIINGNATLSEKLVILRE